MAHPKGQGLLETVVALGIIGVGLVSAITLVTSSFAASREGVGRMVAGNFAREGVEVVRSLRGSVPLDGPGNDRTVAAVFDGTTGDWSLNFSVEEITEPGAQVAPGYQRLLTIAPICRGSTGESLQKGAFPCPAGTNRVGYAAISQVQWTSGVNTRSVTAEEWLYDWR